MDPQSLSHPFGSLNAEPDTRDYAAAAKMRAQAALNGHKAEVEMLEAWLGALRQNDRYRLLDDAHGHPFRNWRQFCVEPHPHGLGYSPEAIDAIVKERRAAQDMAADPGVPALPAHGGAREPVGEQDDVVSLPPLQGNSAEYLTRRLKRDAPEVAERLAAGEFRSARAAAIEAGIIPNRRPPERAARAIARLDDSALDEFVEHLQELLDAEQWDQWVARWQR